MKLIILHDQDGRIVSLGEPRPGPVPGIGVSIIPPKDHAVLEMDRTGELKDKHLREIHRDYVVDVRSKRLVKRSPTIHSE